MYKKQLRLIFSLGLILILSGCSKDVKTNLSPAEHVTESIENTFNQGSIDVSIKLQAKRNHPEAIESEDQAIESENNEIIPKEVMEVLNKLSLQMNYKLKVDKESKTFENFTDYKINYNLLPLLSVQSFSNSNEFGFGITNFYDKYFVMKFSDLFKLLIKDESFSVIQIKPYMDIIMNTKLEIYKKMSESKKYTDIFVKHLDSRLDNGVNEVLVYDVNGKPFEEHVLTYAYKFDKKSTLELFSKIMKEVKNDEDIKSYAKVLSNEILDKMIMTKDYELFDLSEDEILKIKDDLNTEFENIWNDSYVDIEDNFTNLVEEIKESTGLIEDSYENIEVKISINKDQQLRKIKILLISDGVDYNIDYIVNSIGEDVVIESNKDKHIDVAQFLNLDDILNISHKEKLAEIIKEFLIGGITEISDGEGYIALLNDLQPLEEDMGIKVSDIKMYLGMAKSYIENIDLGEIINFIDENLIYSYDDSLNNGYKNNLKSLNKISFISYTSDEYSKIWNVIDDISKKNEVAYQGYFSSEKSVLEDLQKMIDGGSNIIFIDGEQLNEVIFDFVKKYPLVKFVFLNSNPKYKMDNVTTINYQNQEIAFVAGVVAALTSETNKVAFIAEIEDPYTKVFELAFKEGAKSINPEIIVISKWLNSNDYELGKTVAGEIDKENIDVIYEITDKIGNGIIDASVNYNFKIIGNENSYGKNLPNFISSTLKNYNSIVDYIVEDYNLGYVYSNYIFGMSEDAFYMPNGNMSDEIIEIKNETFRAISFYELDIPIYQEDGNY